MAAKKTLVVVLIVFLSIFSATAKPGPVPVRRPVPVPDNSPPIPAERAQVESWFQTNVKPYKERRASLDPALANAENNPKLMKVGKDGEFKSVMDAIKRIPDGNTQRVIISIAPGIYNEKVIIDKKKPFVTLLASDPKNLPTLVFGDTGKAKGTMMSASVIIESDYFRAIDINFKNSGPRPAPGQQAQALALRISGDKASFYNCRFLGFQDTLCDDKGRHFFKNCYIEGMGDFIFGNGKSLYVNTQIHVIPFPQAFITAQGRQTATEDTGFLFVHCRVTGAGRIADLGRAWKPFAKVVFAYTEMSDVIKPGGWNNKDERTVTFLEYKNTGPGSNPGGRVKFSKQLSDADIKPYISLASIEGSKWLLPPHKA
ncbi:pectinesterase 1-like [Cornus florida]|uniref:pectinesterase 1-like n=1 Tax=Cornus florida TaxID=4283 RepID=UPI0028A19D40|nr:pectinesterase 1-like [Cornus florida]